MLWLPDDWAQVMKNTGPGGVYHGWMSPQGKFFYHRNGYPTAIEETLGRTLTVKDGINAIQRNIRNVVKPDADQKFLQQCLTAKERKHIVPKSHFWVCIGASCLTKTRFVRRFGKYMKNNEQSVQRSMLFNSLR